MEVKAKLHGLRPPPKLTALLATLLVVFGVCGCTAGPEQERTQVSYEAYFVHISDFHVRVRAQAQRLPAIVDFINSLDPLPLCVVVSGDLVEQGGGPSGEWAYNFTRNALENLTVDYYTVPGNHDYRYGPVEGRPFTLGNYNHAFPKFAAFPYRATLTARDGTTASLYFLDTGPDVALDANILEPAGEGLTQQQYDVLAEGLQDDVSDYRYVVSHHPAVLPGGDVSQAFEDYREETVLACETFNVTGYLSGHLHRYALTNSTGGTWGGSGTFYFTVPDISEENCVALIPLGGTPEVTAVS